MKLLFASSIAISVKTSKGNLRIAHLGYSCALPAIDSDAVIASIIEGFLLVIDAALSVPVISHSYGDARTKALGSRRLLLLHACLSGCKLLKLLIT
jgi:hypothetical protein